MMKRLVAATIVLAFVGLVSPARGADDPTGTWKMETNFGGKTRESTLKLKLEGEKVTGVYVGGQNNTETPIENGSYKDGKLSFSVTREFNNNKFTSKYTGTVTGDVIKGKSETDFNGQTRMSDFEAKRQK
jgi:hypothetical protein